MELRPHNDCRYPLNRFRQSEHDQDYSDDDESTHAACDQTTECLLSISAAWAKIDHAVKAIQLRFADGSRAAGSRKMPGGT